MTPTAEVLTMTKKGLADFLMELKRTQVRNQTPFDKFVALVLKPSRAKLSPKQAKQLKLLRASEAQRQENYALFVDKQVTAWEDKQRATVDEARSRDGARALVDSNGAKHYNLPAFSLEDMQADIMADRLAAHFHTIRTYLGDLNRDVNAGRVVAYGTDMEKGDWWFSPDPIVVTDEGAIINGQHRLLAAERALSEGLEDAKAPSFVVVWGVDKRAAILMDEARRTASDRRDIALRFARSG